jgi:hypothetical protein
MQPLIELEIDDLDAFDYENAEKAKYNVNDLNAILTEEILYFRKKNEKNINNNLTNGTCSTSTGGPLRGSSKSPLNINN